MRCPVGRAGEAETRPALLTFDGAVRLQHIDAPHAHPVPISFNKRTFLKPSFWHDASSFRARERRRCERNCTTGEMARQAIGFHAFVRHSLHSKDMELEWIRGMVQGNG